MRVGCIWEGESASTVDQPGSDATTTENNKLRAKEKKERSFLIAIARRAVTA